MISFKRIFSASLLIISTTLGMNAMNGKTYPAPRQHMHDGIHQVAGFVQVQDHKPVACHLTTYEINENLSEKVDTISPLKKIINTCLATGGVVGVAVYGYCLKCGIDGLLLGSTVGAGSALALATFLGIKSCKIPGKNRK